jgi:uncharacterized protein (DUF1697 family)
MSDAGERVAMAGLRAIVERLGYSNVRTVLNSGNVVFDADSNRRRPGRIASALSAELGVRAEVMVVPAGELGRPC